MMCKGSPFLVIIATLLMMIGRARASSRHAGAKDSGLGRIDGPDTDFELEKLVVMNRHGHRAPNLPFWTLCPYERHNRAKFGTGPEDLTSVGFDEEYRCGTYLRFMYPDLFKHDYDRRQHFFQAVGEPRTLQSALAIAAGAFPTTKKSPSGRLPHHPNLIPVFSANQGTEYFLNDIPCKKQTAQAVQAWLASTGRTVFAEHHALMRRVFELCGTTEAAADSVSQDLLVKLVVDGIIFEHDFGITPLRDHLTAKEFNELRNVSNSFLFGKLYGTDAQRTFTAAEFPHFMVETLDFLATGKKVKNVWRDNQVMAVRTPVNVFVVHREEIYALAFFFDFRYNATGMAKGEVPAGTSYVFEYLRQRSTGEVFVRAKMWNPRDGEIPLTSAACARPSMCSRAEFKALYQKRVDRTGRWDALCDFPTPAQWD